MTGPTRAGDKSTRPRYGVTLLRRGTGFAGEHGLVEKDRNRITKEIREQILHVYLGDPIKGTELAMSNGLTAAYAYKLANERGLLPTRDKKLLGRSHSARLAST